MDKRLIEEIEQTFEVGNLTAKEYVEVASNQASAEGSGLTLIEAGVVADAQQQQHQQVATRRGVLLRVAYAVGAVAVTPAVAFYSNWGEGHISDWLESDDRVSFSDAFVNLFYMNRGRSDFLQLVPSTASDHELEFSRAFATFVSGHSIVAETEKLLHAYLRRADEQATKLLIADVISGQYVRAGAAGLGKKTFSVLHSSDLNGSNQRLIYADKLLSLAYTSLPRVQALNPCSWGFEQAFEVLNDDHFERMGIEFQRLDSAYSVEVKSRVRIPVDGPYRSVKGFYSINWTLLYWMASHEGENLAQTSAVQYQVLKDFSADASFARSVWNFAFIVAMQLHRMALSSGNRNRELSLRDKFLDICFGSLGGAVAEETRRVQYLRKDDPVAICLAMLVRSDGKLRDSIFASKIDSDRNIAGVGASSSSIVLQRLATSLRASLGDEISDMQAFNAQAGDDGTFETYTMANYDVRESLLNRNYR